MILCPHSYTFKTHGKITCPLILPFYEFFLPFTVFSKWFLFWIVCTAILCFWIRPLYLLTVRKDWLQNKHLG